MPVDRSYVAENDAERQRLRGLVRRLSDKDLERPMEAGWTAAGILAHLAFWDQRIVVLLDEWERKGPSWTPPLENERDIDWINDAGKALCLALPLPVLSPPPIPRTHGVSPELATAGMDGYTTDCVVEAVASMIKTLVRYCKESEDAMTCTAKGVLVNTDFKPVMSTT